MVIRHLVCLVVLSGLVPACGPVPTSTPPGAPTSTPSEAGIEGLVKIGPVSPIIGEDMPSADEPYEATIVIKEGDTGREVATVQSGPDGRFRVTLAPGEYVLEPQSPNPGAPPYAEPQTITVEAGQFTYVEILYESGIR